MAEWTTIESDPGIFSALLNSFGVSGLQVEELWALDGDEILSSARGLLFLFRWRSAKERRAAEAAGKAPPAVAALSPPPHLPQPWFAQQTIANACGTQALLHVVLNLKGGVSLGSTLGPFLDFTSALDVATRGSCFDECAPIRDAHNAFARPEPFVSEASRSYSAETEDPHHFIAYVSHGGGVWELDGLCASGPRFLGKEPPAIAGVTEAPWVALARAALQARIAEYSDTETAFNLLAVVPDPALAMQEEAAALAAAAEDAWGTLLSLGGGGDAACSDPEALIARLGFAPAEGDGGTAGAAAVKRALAGWGTSGDTESVAAVGARYGALADALDTLALRWRGEEEKREAWGRENAKRKTNWVPLIFAALEGLADRGLLTGALDAGRGRQAAAKERARKEGRA